MAAIEGLNPPLASCRPSAQKGISPFLRLQDVYNLSLSICGLIHLPTPFSSHPPSFSLHSSFTFTFHIPPLVTTLIMYRWIGSRLSPRQEVTPVPPTPPLIHCQRCSRSFRDDDAYRQHMQTSDRHHLCPRCGNDHGTHRALQVVSDHLCTSQSFHIQGTRIELANLYRSTAPLSTD